MPKKPPTYRLELTAQELRVLLLMVLNQHSRGIYRPEVLDSLTKKTQNAQYFKVRKREGINATNCYLPGDFQPTKE